MVVGKDEKQNAVKNEESVHTAGAALPEFAKRVVQDAARDVVYGAAVVDEGVLISAMQDTLEHLIRWGN